MLSLLRIKEPGYYPEIKLCGTSDDLYADGCMIDSPDGVVYIGKLIVENVRCPLTLWRSTGVIIDEMITNSTWGDTLNIRRSNLHIKSLYGRDITPKLPYELYHVDTILQAYAVKEDGYTLDKDGVIENIDIDEIDIVTTGTDVNGIMLSELNKYRNFRIGTKKFHFTTNGTHWLNGNNLSNSIFGGRDVKLVSPTGNPVAYLKDRAKLGITSGYSSEGNIFINIPRTKHCEIQGMSSYFNFDKPIINPLESIHNKAVVITETNNTL